MSPGEEREIKDQEEGIETGVEEEMMLTGVTLEEDLRGETTVEAEEGTEKSPGEMTDVGETEGVIEVEIVEVLVLGLLELVGTSVRRKLILDHGGEVLPHHHLAVTTLELAQWDVMTLGLGQWDVMIDQRDVMTVLLGEMTDKRNVPHAESQRNVHRVLKPPGVEGMRMPLLCAGS